MFSIEIRSNQNKTTPERKQLGFQQADVVGRFFETKKQRIRKTYWKRKTGHFFFSNGVLLEKCKDELLKGDKRWTRKERSIWKKGFIRKRSQKPLKPQENGLVWCLEKPAPPPKIPKTTNPSQKHPPQKNKHKKGWPCRETPVVGTSTNPQNPKVAWNIAGRKTGSFCWFLQCGIFS